MDLRCFNGHISESVLRLVTQIFYPARVDLVHPFIERVRFNTSLATLLGFNLEMTEDAVESRT